MSGWAHIHVKKNEDDEEFQSYLVEGRPTIEDLREKTGDFYSGNVKRPYRIVFTTRNDTTDSAFAELCEFENGSLKTIEKFNGYSGACGADVEGELREKYGINVSTHWEVYDDEIGL